MYLNLNSMLEFVEIQKNIQNELQYKRAEPRKNGSQCLHHLLPVNLLHSIVQAPAQLSF